MTDPDNKNSKNSDLVSRVLTAIALIPLIYLIFKGGWPAKLIVVFAGVIMASEVVKIVRISIFSPQGLGLIAAMVGPALAYLIYPDHLNDYALFVLVVAALVLVQLSTGWLTRVIAISISLCLFCITGILNQDMGSFWLAFAVIVIISADSFAYFGGRMIGGAKLAPKISPSKTWSGALCGVSAGAMVGSTFGMIFGYDPVVTGVLGLFIADLSIGGDLLESWFKRHYQVKDSGTILPGHGGFLDRFDGYLLALPFLYLVMNMGILA